MRGHSILIGLLMLATRSSLAAPPQFTDVTTPDIEAKTPHGRGVAWGDFDGDGDEDLYITNWTKGANRIFRNNGDGTFTWVQGTLLDDEGFGGQAIWGDTDNDGDLDIFIVNSGANKFLVNNGDGTFSNFTTSALADGGLSRSASWVDFDNDGFLDLYFSVKATSGGDINRLFKNLGSNHFVVHPAPVLNQSGKVGRGMSWIDFDMDGDQDMYIANGGPPDSETGGVVVDDRNALIRNNGDGNFTDVTPDFMELPDNSRSVTWADFDNDGDFDLLVTTISPAPNKLFRNTGDGFEVVEGFPGALNGRTRDAAWGDYDNDGDLDLYLARQADNRLFENVNGAFVDVSASMIPVTSNSRGVAWADYDDDGDLDLVIASDTLNKLLRNDTVTSTNWLKVKLTGVRTNRSAIGATIKIHTGSAIQVRDVNGGEGYMSQRSLVQHFGLGASSQVERIEVRWPVSGITQVLENVGVNQTLDIVEPTTIATDLNGDGVVDGADIAILLASWGMSGVAADFNNDGTVNGTDLAFLLATWGVH